MKFFHLSVKFVFTVYVYIRQYNNIKITLLLPFLKAEETKACRMKTR